MKELDTTLAWLAEKMLLGELLSALQTTFGTFELLDHWLQGEFHHDLVIRTENAALPAFLVVSTNCNGGVKEVLGLSDRPDRWALWKHRCPASDEFEGELGNILGRARTEHWFEPCEVLADDARSELKPEYRKRQHGGGWEKL